MRTEHGYETAATRYMCMREEGLLSQLSEAQYLDNLKMIGVTWHGPQDPVAETETIRDCEHPACKWQWAPFVDGIRGFEPGRGILDDGTGQPFVVMLCHTLTPVKCPACEARESLRNAPAKAVSVEFSYVVDVDWNTIQHAIDEGVGDLVAARIEALREAMRRESIERDSKFWYGE